MQAVAANNDNTFVGLTNEKPCKNAVDILSTINAWVTLKASASVLLAVGLLLAGCGPSIVKPAYRCRMR